MRSVGEYLQKAAEFDRLAAAATAESLKRRYEDVAACYRLLAAERQRLLDAGAIEQE